MDMALGVPFARPIPKKATEMDMDKGKDRDKTTLMHKGDKEA